MVSARADIVGSGKGKMFSIRGFAAVLALSEIYVLQKAVKTQLRIDCIQPREGRCNTGSRANAARNSIFKDPESLLFADSRDLVAG